VPADQVKVKFLLPESDLYSVTAETLWADPIGPDRYRLDNTPFHAQGYSFKDIVYAPHDTDHEMPVVREAVEKSGHSTYLLWVPQGASNNPDFDQYWKPLADLGCSFEGVGGKMLAVDIPAKTDIHKAYDLMDAGLSADVWDFQEQDCAHAL
jgi:hypothetical protein